MTGVVVRASDSDRARRIRRTAELVSALVSDLAEVVDTHADDIAEWWAQRHRT